VRGGRRTGREAGKPDAAGNLVNTSGPAFVGAGFPYLAANTVDRRGRSVLPPYTIVERAGVRVGFIGVTIESTPGFLLGRHAAGLHFADVSATVDRYARGLRRRVVEAIVVLAHAGGLQRADREARGEIVEETREMTDAVDVVVAGHSHSVLDTRVRNRSDRGAKLVVEPSS
jgi:5'-nucleotidase